MTDHPGTAGTAATATIAAKRNIAFCHASSFTPELHDFFGSTADVLRKIGRVDMGLVERRMFLLALDGDRGAQLHLFEHVEGDTWAICGWRGASIRGLPGLLSEMVFENQGEFCVGKATQGLLGELFGGLDPRGGVDLVEGTGSEVFGPIVSAYRSEGYVRATVVLLC